MLAQRRNPHHDHRQTVVEVFAEIPFLNLLAQVLVRGGHHAHVDLDVPVASHAADAALLQGAQHLGLRRERHVADLVHEERASVGLLELALALLDGRGEGPALVAEQFALDQFGGDGRAVDLDERGRRADALGVQPAGHKLLSRAVFARDQHPGLARGHLVDQLADVFDLGRDADDPLGLGGVRPAAAHGRGGRGRLRGRGIVDGAVQRLQQPVHVDGFCEEILRSVAHGLDRRVDRRVGREGYERDACIRNLALRVGQNHVERNPLAQCRGRSLVLDGFGREPFILQPLAQNVSHAF